MKKDLLLELLVQVKDSSYFHVIDSILSDSNSNGIANVLKLNDEQTIDIINTKSDTTKVAKMYLYLKGDEITEKERLLLENNIYNKNIIFCIKLVNNHKKNYEDKCLEILNIILKSERSLITEMIDKIANRKKIIERDDCLEIIKIISNAKEDYQVISATNVALDLDVLLSKDTLELINIAANACCEEYAKFIQEVATNRTICEKVDALEFVQTIANAEELYQAAQAKNVALNMVTTNKINAICYVKAIAKSKGDTQAKCALSIATNVESLYQKDSLEVVEKTANADEEFQATHICLIAENKHLLTNTHYLDIINNILQTKEEHQAKLIYDLACITDLMQKDDAMEYISIATTCKTCEGANIISELLSNPNNLNNKNTLPIIKKVAYIEEEDVLDTIGVEYSLDNHETFENAFITKILNVDNIDKAIAALNLSSKEEITSTTKVMVKK